ncbi:YbaB/EbfC family nucleoid-associated protein [Actinophytocola gossypii]|uniref:YbaB/EbfC family nucleoid-associated protein n=1 Tax=Actinophytocola gossypii TaxID=2812003 RepID=A0ABT2JFQ7_9PSEU|nr:YbaB/EbfC family nucleoid-associated protein [Actinophytocola gossypii]MCT2586710.1 YbaB/EbfC family nucleoid-associated protein [Actinophytocola gossypii]
MSTPTPEEWLANFNSTIADIQAKTAEFQANLEQSGTTESSPDGSISVSVAPNGSLTDLRIDESAWRGSGAELAGKIMALARKAQRAAAVNVAEAFAPLGADSEAMHMVTGYIPEDEPAEPEQGAGYAFTEEPDETPPPTPPRAEPPGRPSRPPHRADDDDDDFGDDQIFGDRDR